MALEEADPRYRNNDTWDLYTYTKSQQHAFVSQRNKARIPPLSSGSSVADILGEVIVEKGGKHFRTVLGGEYCDSTSFWFTLCYQKGQSYSYPIPISS